MAKKKVRVFNLNSGFYFNKRVYGPGIVQTTDEKVIKFLNSKIESKEIKDEKKDSKPEDKKQVKKEEKKVEVIVKPEEDEIEDLLDKIKE